MLGDMLSDASIDAYAASAQHQPRRSAATSRERQRATFQVFSAPVGGQALLGAPLVVGVEQVAGEGRPDLGVARAREVHAIALRPRLRLLGPRCHAAGAAHRVDLRIERAAGGASRRAAGSLRSRGRAARCDSRGSPSSSARGPGGRGAGKPRRARARDTRPSKSTSPARTPRPRGAVRAPRWCRRRARRGPAPGGAPARRSGPRSIGAR